MLISVNPLIPILEYPSLQTNKTCSKIQPGTIIMMDPNQLQTLPGFLRVSPSPFSSESLFIGIFSLALAGFFGVILGKMIYEPKNPLPQPQSALFPSPTDSLPYRTQNPQPSQETARWPLTGNVCPKAKWIDCTTELKRRYEECTPEYLSRLTKTCPNILGAAY